MSFLAAAHAAPIAATPVGRGALPWWQERWEQKSAELAQSAPELVFYGDSIMQYLERGAEDRFDYQGVWRHYYAGRHAVDLGFKGDPTSALIWRLENGEADHMAPKLAIVLIGANNFGKLHWSAGDSIIGIDRVVTLIHRKLPHTRILLLSVLPSERSAYVDEATRVTNRALTARYGAGQDRLVVYRDLTPLFENHGKFDRALFIDPLLTPPDPPLHPSPEGWRRIAQAIEPVVAETLGDGPRAPMEPVSIYGR